MDTSATSHEEPALPGRCVVRVEGHLEERWLTWFEEFTVVTDSAGTTLHGPVADQAALQGLLQLLHEAGLPLVYVALTDHHDPPAAARAR